jgi:hypothetical protein
MRTREECLGLNRMLWFVATSFFVRVRPFLYEAFAPCCGRVADVIQSTPDSTCENRKNG